ncbi:MAG: TolC family protein [Janthinobacterium lividum]
MTSSYRSLFGGFLLCACLSLASSRPVLAQHPLTLAECKELALKQNKRVAAATYEVAAAQAAERGAGLAGRPTLDGSLTGLHLGQSLGGPGALLPTNLLSGGVTTALPVYTGGKIGTAKALARTGVEAQEIQRSLTETDLLLDVERAYWQAAQVSEKIVLAEKSVAQLQKLQTDLKNEFDAGLIYKNDLLRVDVALNEARLNVANATDSLTLLRRRLAQLTGSAAPVGLLDPATLAEPPLAPADQPEASRYEVQLQQKQIEALEAQKRLFAGDRLPTVALAVSGLTATGKAINVEKQTNGLASYYGLLSVSVPIFDWGRRASRLAEQDARISAQQAQLRETQEQIGLEILAATNALQQATRRIQTAKLSLTQAEENRRLANDRLAAGTIVARDVLEAQLIWQQTYSGLLDARLDYQLATAVYQKAVGQLR